MQQPGDFLDSTTQQLPPSSLTIALVYNLKEEAAPEAASFTGHTESPGTRDRLTLPVDRSNSEVSLSPVAPLRVNDLYAEWDTMETVSAVRSALEEHHRVTMVEADEAAWLKILENRPDFAFNMAEGLRGVSRESQIPAMLEMLDIPYLGSDPLTLGICLDKSRAKEILSYHGIRTPGFAVVRSMDDFEEVRVRFPSMVKPLHEGSSKGIYNSCVVRSTEELEREVRHVLETYSEPALVEDFLPGREFTAALIGNGADVRVLPVVEIRFDALPEGVNPIYSYEAKWIWDRAENPLDIFECPAAVDDRLREEIEGMCRKAYHALGCRDWSRIDLRLDARGRPHILEVNPLPGILPKPEDNSCFPKAARAAGMSYKELINTVLSVALRRCGL